MWAEKYSFYILKELFHLEFDIQQNFRFQWFKFFVSAQGLTQTHYCTRVGQF